MVAGPCLHGLLNGRRARFACRREPAITASTGAQTEGSHPTPIISFHSNARMYARQPTNQRTNRPTDQRINGPTDQRTNGPTNQPTNQPTNEQTNNRPIGQSTQEQDIHDPTHLIIVWYRSHTWAAVPVPAMTRWRVMKVLLSGSSL